MKADLSDSRSALMFSLFVIKFQHFKGIVYIKAQQRVCIRRYGVECC